MRIAVIGSGIAGLVSAYLLSRRHEVVLYEADERLGGHTHTHDLVLGGRHVRVDTGFIVHNPANYPLLTRLFAELDVRTKPTTMSFSVHSDASGVEYGAGSLDALFCQRRNLASPRFLGMLADLARFYRIAPALLAEPGPGPTLGEWLARHRFGAAFRDEHLVPMASALWSSPSADVLAFPARHLVAFMANHEMLRLAGRPQWRVVEGGSDRYIQAMAARWKVRVQLRSAVQRVRRDEHGVAVSTHGGDARYDHVVLACHSHQALELLPDADDREAEILGAIAYQPNDVVLHTDASLLPRDRRAWSAWNAHVPRAPGAACTVSYHMNQLQGLQTREPLIVTLNRSEAIDPAKVLRRMRYSHPQHTHASVAAQARRGEIQGRRRTWFAGAYWGWGFHEDGVRSGVDVARALGVDWGGEPARERRAEAAGA